MFTWKFVEQATHRHNPLQLNELTEYRDISLRSIPRRSFSKRLLFPISSTRFDPHSDRKTFPHSRRASNVSIHGSLSLFLSLLILASSFASVINRCARSDGEGALQFYLSMMAMSTNGLESENKKTVNKSTDGQLPTKQSNAEA